jgi:hypothetical protein
VIIRKKPLRGHTIGKVSAPATIMEGMGKRDWRKEWTRVNCMLVKHHGASLIYSFIQYDGACEDEIFHCLSCTVSISFCNIIKAEDSISFYHKFRSFASYPWA